MSDMSTTRTSTPLGQVEGSLFDGYERYAGIRYAAAPVGELRFRAPQAVTPWDGVLDATAFGSSCPQPIVPGPSIIGVSERAMDEDCLFLNVFTPSADEARRPVMVWIHGGAYTMGSGDLYDGSQLVRRGDVVVVTLNYRLGVLGWLSLDHLDPALAGSANNGIRDQIEALRWVQANIASFGGDPENVTIFGESAGGGSVFALLAAPDADGLYHRAIAQSGAAGWREPCQPERFAADIVAALGAPDPAASPLDVLRAASADELLTAQSAVVGVGLDGFGDDDHTMDGSGPGLHPVVDGVVITRHPAAALADKGSRNVPVIIGTNRDEGTLFTLNLSGEITDEAAAASLRRSSPDPVLVVKTHRALNTGRPLLVDLFTHGIFRQPSIAAADAQTTTDVPAWVYLFTWATPVFGGALGASHALEIPFVFGMLGDPLWAPFLGATPPPALADAMQDAWIAFARTGDPNHAGLPTWPAYDTDRRPTMLFDATSTLADDPEGDIRRVWSGSAS
jgi:para-nitrobenzyl esterase